MKRATDKQKSFIRILLRRTGESKSEDWLEFVMTRKEASNLISELLAKAPPKRVGAQLSFPLPAQEPELVTSELGEFKRWARGVYQRGEKTILELIDLQRERFGIPDLKANG